jgi:hypothetical protein
MARVLPEETAVAVARVWRVADTPAMARVLPEETAVAVARVWRVAETPAMARVLPEETAVAVARVWRVAETPGVVRALPEEMVAVAAWVWPAADATPEETPFAVARVPSLTTAVRANKRGPYREGERSFVAPMVGQSPRTLAVRCTELRLPAAWPAATGW